MTSPFLNFSPSTAGPSSVRLPPLPGAQPLSFGGMSAYGQASQQSAPAWSLPVMSNTPTTAGQAFTGSSGTVPTAGITPNIPNTAPTGDMSFGSRLKNTFTTKDGGFDLGAVGNLAQTIGAFGTLWSGVQSNKIAKDTLAFQKDAYNTNLSNQISSYNLALEDRIKARYAQNGRSTEDADGYINQHKLGS